MNNTITRRAALGGLACAPLAAAAAEPSLPDIAPEHPWDRARRLAEDLSRTLAEAPADGAGPNGRWFAQVRPWTGSGYDVMFGWMPPERRGDAVSLECRGAIEAHQEARRHLEAMVKAADPVALGREPSLAAKRRQRHADRAEAAAFLDLCAFPPLCNADAFAKVDYLKPYWEAKELTSRHVTPLIEAGVRG